MRKNLSIALPVMSKATGIDKTTFGIFFTLHELSYGFAKMAAGIAADRYNPRVLLTAGMLLCALTNLLFGFGAGVTALGILWVLNGWFQGFGFPPCARVLSYWYAPRERGVYWGLFNTSHQVGTIVISVLAAYLASQFGWRWAFYIPAMIGLAGAAFLWNRVRDRPQSLGLPSVEDYHSIREGSPAPVAHDEPGPIGFRVQGQPVGSIHDDAAQESTAEIVRRRVWRNPALWMVCLGNFFVYVVRSSVLNWAPTYLSEAKHFNLHTASGLTALFELAGLFGCLVSGWVTDRFLGGRRAPACVLWMMMCSAFVFAMWQSTSTNPAVYAFLLSGVGFSVYGPQFLVGVMVADLATKRAAGTAVGLSGLFGYMSGFISGGLMGYVATHYGWDAGVAVILGGATLACIPFALTWNAKAPEDDE
jgi:OPA family glycerol-3-phosphate transporter-like MFS transporter/OPA family sugar phosphate sensor protein UhpC-like MFS transporter